MRANCIPTEQVICPKPFPPLCEGVVLKDHINVWSRIVRGMHGGQKLHMKNNTLVTYLFNYHAFHNFII